MELLAYDKNLLNVVNGAASTKIVPLNEISTAMAGNMKQDPSLETFFQNQAEAFLLYSSPGMVSTPAIQSLGKVGTMAALLAGDDAGVCIKTGYITNDEYFVIKVAGGCLGMNNGSVMCFSQKTLAMEKLFLDEGIMTEVRTAAASALASKILAPKHINAIGIIGGGVQAIWQLRFLSAITSCRNVVVKTRSAESAKKFIKTMADSKFPSDREWNIHQFCEQQRFKNCQLIHTLTPSKNPVLTLDDVDLTTELHITAVGCDTPGKNELSLGLVKLASQLICDSLEQSKFRGEFQHLFHESREIFGKVKELGQLLIENGWVVGNALPVLRNAGSPTLTVFDTSGTAVQDIQIAKLVSQLIDA